jgi:hypothetical protein
VGLLKVKLKLYFTFERKWSSALLSTVACDVHINMLSDFGFLNILRSGSRILHSGGN